MSPVAYYAMGVLTGTVASAGLLAFVAKLALSHLVDLARSQMSKAHRDALADDIGGISERERGS